LKIMGIVRLAPGKAAFYDELTNIHLTISRPEGRVIAGMNTTNLKKAVVFSEIKLIAGTLDTVQTAPAAEPAVKAAAAAAPAAPVVEEPAVKEPTIEEPKAEEPAVEETKAEQPAPEPKAEVADEVVKKPAAGRKSAKGRQAKKED
jgi:hypothetical protein